MNELSRRPEILPPVARLVEMPKPATSPQKQVALKFLEAIAQVENFVILAHTKDGRLLVLPCVDPDLSPWDLVDAAKAQHLESVRNKLAGPQRPSFA